jgi:large repetitive protein
VKPTVRSACRRLGSVTAGVIGLTFALGVAGGGAASAATVVPVWPVASQFAAVPSGAITTPGEQSADFASVTCVGPGNCVAVGAYGGSNGNADFQPMVSADTDGVWGTASKITMPSGANTTAGLQRAFLNSVTCTSSGNCVAAGEYADTNGTFDFQAMVATETGGVWAPATKLMLPTGANTTASDQKGSLYSVTCTSPGNCVGVGEYTDSNGTGDYQAMVATETGGTWGQASKLVLPTGANTAAGGQYAALNSVNCTSQGNCVAVGNYTDTNGTEDLQAMIATETGGVWGQASKLTLPAGANTASGGQAAFLNSVNCTSPGNCVAVGGYNDSNGSYDGQGMIAAESSGTWGPGSALALPSGATTTAGDQHAELNSVTCTSSGNCVAVGEYADTNGEDNYQAMVTVESSGVWGATSELTLPSGATTTAGDQDADPSSITCTSQGKCVVVGSYADANDDEAAMVLGSVPSLTVSTSSLPAAVVGSPYLAQLSATGGAGSYLWSLSSGSLPAGLSLNATTGVISGTPTAAGTSSVTLAASDPGPPRQQASTVLSILVSAAPAKSTVAKPTSTVATVGNQRITVRTPSLKMCTAATKRLAVTLEATAIPGSKAAKLKFSHAAFYIDKGVKHKRHKTVRTHKGKHKTVVVIVYGANATTHHVPVTSGLTLKGVKTGIHKLRVVVFDTETTRKHGHKKTMTVSKTLKVSFRVC